MVLAVWLEISQTNDDAIHPAWIHAQLCGSVCSTAHERALACWETLPPPEIHVLDTTSDADATCLTSRRANEICFAWTEADAGHHAAALRDLADRYTRWQHSRTGVIVSVRTEPSRVDSGQHWTPTDDSDGDELRVAKPGFSAAQVQRDWRSAAESQRYQRVDATRPSAVDSGHGVILPFALPEDAVVEPEESGRASDLLRRAVLSVVPDPLPGELTGHGANGRPHVAFVPLLDAGLHDATGDLWGVGVVLPRATGEWRVKVTDALVSGELHLRLSGRKHTLWHAPKHPLLPSLTASARTWATVTPMVLDRFSGRGKESAEVARGLGQLGLPEPDRVIVSRDPLVPGGVSLARGNLTRRDRRPYTHAEIEFSAPVRGPVLLGAQRHVGMGLCVPLE